ncbi:MAG TPA: TetR/AcrR family transcriptional regulator [Candidatus Dormibacteraeota bacterium]|nr:TetR/AcrR family transcriptional regulator [Candidatus Dormibacteraeota bacterium]
MEGPKRVHLSESSGLTTDRSVALDSNPKLREIVERAASLFDERGYHRVSMEEIAAAVGIRKPSLYHYVHSKDEILALIHREFMDLVISRAEARQAVAMSPEQQLLEFMADILELMHTHRGHVRVFFEHHRELPDAERKIVWQERDRYEAMVEKVIRQGIDSGAFRPVDARLTTLALFGMCNWAYQWYKKGGPLRTREIAYMFWDLLLRGLHPG